MPAKDITAKANAKLAWAPAANGRNRVPNAPPVDTPMMHGSAIGLRNSPCITALATPKATAKVRDNAMRGNRSDAIMASGIRDRIWEVLTDWYHELGNGAIVMTWRDPTASGEQQIRTLGEAPKQIVDADGIHLVKYRQQNPQ